ncbi:MAG: peptidylprolyl isomerase [Akkermansiaceae bacterium]
MSTSRLPHMRHFIITLLCCLSLTQLSNGQLIAEVRTSMGNFSITLETSKARRTVAHFMRLANGQQPILDHTTGQVIQGVKFYDGLKFHKTVNEAPPFFPALKKYIQTGSRDGTDAYNPGYVIRDEIRSFPNGNLLAPHTQYVVSMVPATGPGGIPSPHSSSTQFLITLVNDNSLNGVQSAFGKVNQLFINYDSNNTPISVGDNGWLVVQAIHASQNPVTIYNITFRRLDAAAIAFDETQLYGELPLVGQVGITSLEHTPTHINIGHPNLPGSEFHIYSSTDLFTWSHVSFASEYLHTSSPTPPEFSLTHANTPKWFFKLSAVTYPQIATPNNLLGKYLLVGGGTSESISFVFDTNGISPYYNITGTNTNVALNYTYTPLGPFYGDLHITNPELGETIYRLYFGGQDENITDTEQMSAIIYRPMQAPKASHFEILIP